LSDLARPTQCRTVDRSGSDRTVRGEIGSFGASPIALRRWSSSTAGTPIAAWVAVLAMRQG
jgi:hypothetical protein